MGSACSRVTLSPDVFLLILPESDQAKNLKVGSEGFPQIYRLAASETPYRTVRAMCEDPISRCDVRLVGNELKIFTDTQEPVGKVKPQEGTDQFVIYIGTQFTTLHKEHRCHVQYPPSTDAQTGRMLKAVLRRRVEDLDRGAFGSDALKLVQETLPLLLFYHHPVEWSEARQRYRCALCGSKAHRAESWTSLMAHLEREHGLSTVLIAKHFAAVHCAVCGDDLDLKEQNECACHKRWCVESSKADMANHASRTDVVDPFTYLDELRKSKRTIVDVSPTDRQNNFEFSNYRD